MHTRRQAMKNLLAGSAALTLANSAARAADAPLDFVTMGYTLAIHVPSQAAMREILPQTYKYALPKVTGIEQIQTITQSLIAGTAEFGASDFLSTIKAVQSGADLAVIGNVYVNTSLVLAVNNKKIQTLKDLFKPDVTLAVNGKIDGTFVAWAGALVQAGLDPSKLQTIEMGGSGSRMRGMLAQRIDGTAVHFDQAEALEKTGNVAVLIEPWKIYHPWMNEVWVTQKSKLGDPLRRQQAIDILKATLTAFRRANSDFAWYAERYRRYATVPNISQVKDEDIRHIWETLSGPVAAWPNHMNFSIDNAQRLMPGFQGTGALKGPLDFASFMQPEFLQQALRELG